MAGADRDAPRARIDAWREAGTDRIDPVGFHRLDALLRRCESADVALQAVLQPRIDALVAAHADAIARTASASPCDDARPLATLVAECDARRSGIEVDAEVLERHAPATLRPQPQPQAPALQQARKLWTAVRTERQLRQSLQKPHEDTGPLNSAQLVNRMLLRMGEASPGYLERLIAYVDVLSELEHWLGPVAVAEPASPSPGRKPVAKRAPRKRS